MAKLAKPWGKTDLTSGQKWSNFGAKRAQLKKPDNCLQAIADKMSKKQHWLLALFVFALPSPTCKYL